MPRRNGPAPGGRGHMKGRSEFGRRGSSRGMHPVRHNDIFVTPGMSRGMGNITGRNRESGHTHPDTSIKDRISRVAVVDENTCKGCGACLDACLENAITIDNDVARIDIRICRGCADCIDSCPFGSISMDYTS